MNFIPLAKYLDTLNKVYSLPGCDCCIYYNHSNVFRRKNGFSEAKKTTFKDLYFIHSAAKLICCTAIFQLAEKGLLSLDDRADKYLPSFNDSSTIEEMLRKYSQTLDFEEHKFNHKNISAIVEKLTKKTLDEYLSEAIFKPLHMKNSSFTLNSENKKRIGAQYIITKSGESKETDRHFEEMLSKNEGCIITSVSDYARFAETLCNKGVSKHNVRILSAKSVLHMINDVVYNETTEKNCFVCVGYNGSLVSIDIDNKVTIVYAQHVRNCGAAQMEIYPKIRLTAYECLGVHKWSKGFNVFP